MRQKISFEIVNKDNYSVISKKDIYETNARIKKEMKEIIKVNLKKINKFG